ncbi:MAG: peptidase M16 [Bacteroidetes bacterium GWF2_42_66]|nr:MAG: peptidase M16 [Bacteroidetes bacterium GWA2_42_15]OFX98444.1 MAG: peptidase M16 [Bacteroidetes bacterium GWE2_42_39]OFY42829.1 MAG: peptidase M16 [Bacteroidetes bacterium GWF2_42_66]HBL74454.1 insulinase family protein [Prolixibacteraceae bacterium]HCU61936.1 insulinase family protein [Prolixibacteraceae bacterium]
MQTLFFRISFLILFILPFGSFAQIDLNQLAPVDPEVKIGKLPNGMTYYIRHNEEPKDRASFYIIQNVGALLENDNQNGLAHFLEHMAFNGTQHFEGKGIINFLEKNGVAFGRNINAYTAFDQTVYNLSDVPTTKEGLADSCLLVLHDWSHYLLLTEEEIDAERGVITEEWRTRRNAAFRLRSQFFPVLLKGSKYAVRDVIGDLDVIKNFEYKTLRDFYHSWYRTDLQAIAIVGDISVDEIEAKVKKLFSEIPAVENAPVRESYPIPEHDEDYYVLATDKEASQTAIQILTLIPNKDEKEKNLNDLRLQLVHSLFNSMFNQRISELLQKGTPPFITGTSSIGGFLRGYDVYTIGVTAKPNQEDIALEAILIENERVKRFGFTGSELERAKTNYLARLESSYKQKDKIDNDSYISNYVEHFILKDDIPSFDFEYDFSKKMIPTISVEEIAVLSKEWMKEQNRTIIITGPSEDARHLTEAETKAIIAKVKSMPVEPYVDVATSSSLISGELKGSKIVKTKKLDQFDAVEWTLANGAKVIFRKADFEKDQVTLSSFSPGGNSLLDDKYVESASVLGAFVGNYGLGDFDAITLRKMLTGKKVSVNTNIGTLTEGISGSGTPKDFETMLQLVYLSFEKPRFDLNAHNAYMARYKAYVANMANNPQKIMQDSLSMILTNYHPRTRIFNVDLLDKVDFAQIEEIYRSRIKDASDFTFIIVGNIDETEVKPLVEKYIGSLTDIDRKEQWKDLGIEMPEGKTHKDISIKMETPKSNVNLAYSAGLKYTPWNNMALSIISGILKLRYTESIREKEGGTYGVSVKMDLSHYPKPEASANITFDCDPEKADHLKSLVYGEIDKIIAEGPTQVDLDKTIENIRKSREQSKQHNNYWSSALYNYYFHGVDNNDPANFENILNKITTADIQKVAKQFFGTADVVDVVFFPKTE